MQTPRIPAHIKYPGMVVLLLAGTVTSQMFLLRAALSDNGPQVEEDYYQRAVDWDKEVAERDAFNKSGMRVGAQFRSVGADTELTFVFHDANDAPVKNLQGNARVQHIAQAEPLFDGKLEPVPQREGAYRVIVNTKNAGFWDSHLTMKLPNGKSGRAKVRVEVGYE